MTATTLIEKHRQVGDRIEELAKEVRRIKTEIEHLRHQHLWLERRLEALSGINDG